MSVISFGICVFILIVVTSVTYIYYITCVIVIAVQMKKCDLFMSLLEVYNWLISLVDVCCCSGCTNFIWV